MKQDLWKNRYIIFWLYTSSISQFGMLTPSGNISSCSIVGFILHTEIQFYAINSWIEAEDSWSELNDYETDAEAQRST